MSRFGVVNGDCLEVMARMPANTVDSIVTDPPYGLTFMGKAWDHGVPGAPFWREALRIAKPGAHLLAFGGTRTFHRLATAIEDAGWELRDTIMWVYGTGFPKSLDVSKAIDKAAGAERERVPYTGGIASGSNNYGGGGTVHVGTKVGETPVTTDAAAWEGWGTALKPSWEPIIVARKPLEGTVASNVLKHGTGGINVGACRVPTTDKLGGGRLAGPTDMSQTCGGPEWDRPWMHDESKREFYAEQFRQKVEKAEALGRWPANLVHDGSDEVLALFPRTAPSPKGSVRQGGHHRHDVGLQGSSRNGVGVGYGDEGSAARFFYCAKASPSDRDEGLDTFDDKQVRTTYDKSVRDGHGNDSGHARKNIHPTVKPTDLMRWCCRLVTPPGGTVLDPFAGSCSTGKAAILEGFNALMIEQDARYAEIGKARMEAAAKTENK